MLKQLLLPICIFASVTFSPAAAPSPALVERWQKAAIQKYPALAKAGSPFNERFLAIVQEKKRTQPAFFERADWPMQAADAAAAALKADEAAARKMAEEVAAREAEERAKNEEIAAMEAEWEKDKPKWIFERLVWGDTEEKITKKLTHSKLLTARVPPGARASLDSRFRWEMGESKYDLNFDMQPALSAIVFQSLPQDSGDLGDFIKEDWEKIRAAATERIGAPVTSVPYPTTETLTKGGTTVTDQWQSPLFVAALGIREDGGQCRVVLRISTPAQAK